MSSRECRYRRLLQLVMSNNNPNKMPDTSSIHSEATAFKRYIPDTTPTISQTSSSNSRRQSLTSRSLEYYRTLNLIRKGKIGCKLKRRRNEKKGENSEAPRAPIPLPPGTRVSKLKVWVSDVPRARSSSQERMVDLRVTWRGDASPPHVNVLIRLLQFLKPVQNLTLIAMGAKQETAFDQAITCRLRITEGSEWDESAFEEAVTDVMCTY